mmetsp:Transcript_28874/g.54141  ORF Transcript_28874/g.54141 Transcript_28874/m.54141 type:complete len:343 (+) Transcript_28874:49-1077(+)
MTTVVSPGAGRLGRSSTPPRSAGPRLLRICLDERVLGGVEVSENSTLAQVRQSILEDEIGGVPSSFCFLFGGAPVSRRQENRRKATDCFPFLTIIPEDLRIERTGSITSPGEAAGLPAEALTFAAEDATEGQAVGGGSTLELQITDGPLEGLTVTVAEDGARLGRHTSNTLVIPEAGISRFHCEIRFADGDFCIKDLGSTTGTFFYLRPHGQFQIFPGLMIKLGETEMQVLSQNPSPRGAELSVMFFEGPFAGHKVTVPAAGITIGRVSDNTLVLLQDGTVSAHHAMLFHENGEFFIQDLGSCNGTCVRLSPERASSDWHPIMDGDVLGAGCTKIRCKVRQP